MKIVWVSILSLFLLACSENFQATSQGSFKVGDETGNSDTPPDVKDIADFLWICSELDFKNVYPPEDLSVTEINLFSLALNISGSFEGHQKWKNITNNFDGMGLSLGLLNQTLGTGSLQPLMQEYRSNHLEAMQEHFSLDQWNAVDDMLDNYFPSQSSTLSKLDITQEGVSLFGAKEDQSVSWALDHLYSDSGRTFYPEWKVALQEMAESPRYREIQLNAALKLHNKAMGYLAEFDLKEIRSYLFLFDIVVQNGGFYAKNKEEYRDFLKDNPNATERQRLEFLLQSRLVQTRSRFREDVRLRKQSLIDGQGRVHGSNRQYETQHCYTGNYVAL